MNKVIGITGIMGSGKTTLCKKIIETNENIKYINVDNFRLDLRNNNIEFQNELFMNIKGITDLKDINKYIYNNDKNMSIYKKALYKQLYKYINNQYKNQTIILDWALIIDDNLIPLCDKIILLICSNEEIYKRLNNSYWPLSEIKHRISLQLNNDKKIKILEKSKKEYLIINSEEKINYKQIIKYIKE